MEKTVRIEKAELVDAWNILNLQKLAFRSEADLYNDYSIDPLTQTIESVRSEFDTKTFLKAAIENEIIGSVRFYLDGDVCHIQRLMVHPDFQNRGIGKRLIDEAEKFFPGAKTFEMFTADKSAKNLGLYKKLGYETYKIEVVKTDMNFLYMRKSRNG
jgi:ribosomal protein S18 acetylase RimI-like enzyme